MFLQKRKWNPKARTAKLRVVVVVVVAVGHSKQFSRQQIAHPVRRFPDAVWFRIHRVDRASKHKYVNTRANAIKHTHTQPNARSENTKQT